MVCAGIGAARAVLAVQAALAEQQPMSGLISVGFAGACDPGLRVGDVIHAGLVIDTLSGERFGDTRSPNAIASARTVADPAEKQRLYVTYGAKAVDMEASTVARLAQMNGLTFEAIKAISDEASLDLGDLGRFTTHDGQFREIAFAFHATLRPKTWRRLIQLAANSKTAQAALALALNKRLLP